MGRERWLLSSLGRSVHSQVAGPAATGMGRSDGWGWFGRRGQWRPQAEPSVAGGERRRALERRPGHGHGHPADPCSLGLVSGDSREAEDAAQCTGLSLGSRRLPSHPPPPRGVGVLRAPAEQGRLGFHHGCRWFHQAWCSGRVPVATTSSFPRDVSWVRRAGLYHNGLLLRAQGPREGGEPPRRPAAPTLTLQRRWAPVEAPPGRSSGLDPLQAGASTPPPLRRKLTPALKGAPLCTSDSCAPSG